MYSTDNGPHYNSWPDGAISPFRSEKNSNWEGAYRVPCFLRWPGHYQAGVTLNGIVCPSGHADDVPLRGGRAGHRREVQGRARGGGKSFHVVLDGKDMNEYFSGETDRVARATSSST